MAKKIVPVKVVLIAPCYTREEAKRDMERAVRVCHPDRSDLILTKLERCTVDGHVQFYEAARALYFASLEIPLATVQDDSAAAVRWFAALQNLRVLLGEDGPKTS